jgi:CDP-6-deoxy-D-xylo-4-hexulose-3-dehydrase
VALSALTSLKLGKKRFGKRPQEPGDEVLTVACGFPITIKV